MYQLKLLDPRFKNGTWEKPRYATPGSAAIDLRAAITEELILNPGDCVLIPTGIAIWLQDRTKAGFIFPRSGLGSKGIVLGNLTGIIDSDYQGELKVSLWNRGRGAMRILPGDHIAQYLVGNVFQINFNEVEEFAAVTERGEGGFGSTDVGYRPNIGG